MLSGQYVLPFTDTLCPLVGFALLPRHYPRERLLNLLSTTHGSL